MSWPPPAPGSAQTRRDITNAVTGRFGDPRDYIEAALWRVLTGKLTSTGMRALRDRDMDWLLDQIEAAYKLPR